MRSHLSATLVGVALLAVTSVASADPRPFTFSNDTYPLGKGDWEYEQWVTWRHHAEDEPAYDRIDFRHEFEFGIADNFDLAFYLPSWRYEDSEEHAGARFDSIDVEGIVYLSNPIEDPIGVGLYAEVKVGEDFIEFENKLLLQKNVGNWVFVYNLVAETEIEGAFDDEEENELEGELKNTFGAAYAIAPGLFLGGEAVVEQGFEDWTDAGHTTVYAGPVFSYQRHERVWFTVTPMYQLTDTEDEPDFNIRTIIGIQF